MLILGRQVCGPAGMGGSFSMEEAVLMPAAQGGSPLLPLLPPNTCNFPQAHSFHVLDTWHSQASSVNSSFPQYVSPSLQKADFSRLP